MNEQHSSTSSLLRLNNICGICLNEVQCGSKLSDVAEIEINNFMNVPSKGLIRLDAMIHSLIPDAFEFMHLSITSPICSSCLEYLLISYKFYLRCKYTEDLIQKYLSLENVHFNLLELIDFIKTKGNQLSSICPIRENEILVDYSREKPFEFRIENVMSIDENIEEAQTNTQNNENTDIESQLKSFAIPQSAEQPTDVVLPKKNLEYKILRTKIRNTKKNVLENNVYIQNLVTGKMYLKKTPKSLAKIQKTWSAQPPDKLENRKMKGNKTYSKRQKKEIHQISADMPVQNNSDEDPLAIILPVSIADEANNSSAILGENEILQMLEPPNSTNILVEGTATLDSINASKPVYKSSNIRGKRTNSYSLRTRKKIVDPPLKETNKKNKVVNKKVLPNQRSNKSKNLKAKPKKMSSIDRKNLETYLDCLKRNLKIKPKTNNKKRVTKDEEISDEETLSAVSNEDHYSEDMVIDLNDIEGFPSNEVSLPTDSEIENENKLNDDNVDLRCTESMLPSHLETAIKIKNEPHKRKKVARKKSNKVLFINNTKTKQIKDVPSKTRRYQRKKNYLVKQIPVIRYVNFWYKDTFVWDHDYVSFEKYPPSKGIKCHVCSEIFATYYLMKQHMKNHCTEIAYKCYTCLKECDSIYELNQHMLVHKSLSSM